MPTQQQKNALDQGLITKRQYDKKAPAKKAPMKLVPKKKAPLRRRKPSEKVKR